MKRSNLLNEKINFEDLVSKRLKLLHLSKITPSILHSWSSKPEFFKYLEFKPFQNISDSKHYLQKLEKRSNGVNGYYWSINLNDNTVIGNYGIMNINREIMIGELGYGIHPSFWGKNYFKEATEIILEYLFCSLNFNKLWAKTHVENKGSIKGLTSCGFFKEKVLKKFYFDKKSNTKYDAIVYSINKVDYTHKKKFK